MAYLKKEYRQLIERMDNDLKIPRGWYFFVKKEQEKHNFIVKSKGRCTCNNCNFQFKSGKTINEYEKCPKCHNSYLIKQSNYSWHIFTKRLILLNKLDNKWIIRLFEIFTRYSREEIYHSEAAEYGRIIIDKSNNKVLELANDRFVNSMWGNTYVNHTHEGKKWRVYNEFYNSFDSYGKVYDKNLKKLFENTEFQYSQLWKLANKNDELSIKYHLINNFPSTELLTKMKLYKLAVNAGDYNKGKNFKDRFGVEKNYYPFMKKYNIDSNELNILNIYKKQNIDDIRFLKQFYISDIKKVSEYIKLDKFISYAKATNKFDIKMYIDYLGFLKKLKIDLRNKRYIFPENLKEKHDEYARQVLIKDNAKVNRAIEKRYKQLKKNTYNNEKYIVMPAESYISLEDESEQQNHCVRTYAERYAKGKCDIYFMRETKTPKKSLVTIEVIDGKIRQSRIKDNEDPNRSQKLFLKKWEKEVLQAA